MKKTKLADYLAILRRTSLLSQKEWAAKSGISRVTLWRWENGITLPREMELIKALEALGADGDAQRKARKILEIMRHGSIERLARNHPLPLSHRGDLLRALRLRRGLSQVEAATRAEIPRSSLTKWERMETWPASARLRALCIVYTASEQELLALTLGWEQMGPIPSFKQIRNEVLGWKDKTELNELLILAYAAHLSVPNATPEMQRVRREIYLHYASILSFNYRLDEAGNYLERARLLLPARRP